MHLDAEFVASNKDLFLTAPESLNPTDAAEVTETASVEKANQKTVDIQAVPPEDPYSEFLASQKKREKEWRANWRDAKKPKLSAPSTPSYPASGTDSEDSVLDLRKKLAEKNAECSSLRIKFENNEELLKKQMDFQESVLKMLSKIQGCVAGLEEKMAAGFSQLEERLEGLERQTVNPFPLLNATISSGCVNEGVADETDSEDLATINIDTLNTLCEENQPETSLHLPSALQSPCTAQKVGEELIGTCVTPTKIKLVQQTLGRENERHLCALKLLPFFFSKEELATSNTDGSHDKKCLDNNKLNSLKVLLFTSFPVSCSEEKDKAWRVIKGKINSKCRAAKRLVKDNVCERPL